MTQEELTTELTTNVSSIASFLNETEITSACGKASKETGWPFPVTGDFKELWIAERAKRWCFQVLWEQSARKFKVEQLNLNQRFDHYGKLIEKMDKDFEKAREEHPEMFETFTNENIVNRFGSVVSAGFVYDAITGKDITHLIS